MKRFILLFFVVALLHSPMVNAQVLSQVRTHTTPPNSELYNDYDIDQERRELKNITGLIDRFIKYTQNEEWGKAEQAKSSLLVHIRDEIQQTKIKLRRELHKAERGDAIDVYTKREADKNNRRVIENYDLKLFKNRLEEQEHLFRKLKALHLGDAPNKWKNAKEHEQLMLRFENTLKEEIMQLKGKL